MKRQTSPKHLSAMSHLGEAFLTWRRYLQRSLNPYGITLKQEFVLRRLLKEEQLNPSDIAEMLYCDRPTASVVINNLEKQGWVYREREEGNRKYIRILLSDAGRQKIEELNKVEWGSFDPLACFSSDELHQFETLLARLNAHMEQIRETAGQDEESKKP